MQVLVHLLDDLADRFKSIVPKRLRSAFIVDLLSKAIPENEDALFNIAIEVESDQGVSELESDWEVTVEKCLKRSEIVWFDFEPTRGGGIKKIVQGVFIKKLKAPTCLNYSLYLYGSGFSRIFRG